VPLCGTLFNESSVHPWTRGDFKDRKPHNFVRFLSREPTPAASAVAPAATPPMEGIFVGDPRRAWRQRRKDGLAWILPRGPSFLVRLNRA